MKAWLLLLLATVVACAAGLWLGGAPDDFVLWQLRVPRVAMGWLVGATMGLAGAVYQCLFENPLATPSTVGTTGGAALGALAATVFLGPGTVAGLSVVIIAAFAGALGVTAIIALIAFGSRARINDVLLAGIAISLAAGALSSGIKFTADMASTMQAVRWSLGNLAQVGYQRVWLMLPFALVAGVLMLGLTRELAALAGGELKAQTQGVDVRRLRTLGLAAGSLGLGAAVALCGPIAFVGLIVPHLVRGTLGASRHVLLPGSLIGGGAFLVACDTLARVGLADREIPVGVITAGLGAPLIVWIVARQRNQA
ncbi:MAG: iron ABC transporter permease [Xanthomonadales bacterium]|nr:iron ABC transporter permease [Xanthomonadales bacterium]